MDNNDVKVIYSEYAENPVVRSIEMELIEDVNLKLAYNETNKTIGITMSDTITDNTELSGCLELDRLNYLIRALVQIRNQLKD